MKVCISVRFWGFFVLILTAAAFTSVLRAQPPAAVKTPVVFSEKDREFALKYLNETKEDYVKQISGLSDAQLNFRAGEGRWTIAEIAEHITVTEGALFAMITGQVMKAPAPKCEDVFRVGDTAIVLAITNRSQKFQAPEQIRPNGRFKTREDILTSFEKARNTTIDFMKANKFDLRNVFMQNPFGMMDGFQWFVFLTGHSDRHLARAQRGQSRRKIPGKIVKTAPPHVCVHSDCRLTWVPAFAYETTYRKRPSDRSGRTREYRNVCPDRGRQSDGLDQARGKYA